MFIKRFLDEFGVVDSEFLDEQALQGLQLSLFHITFIIIRPWKTNGHFDV